MHTTVIREVIAFIFGYKYYCNIINVRGTDRHEICSYIFRSKQEAIRHKQTLASLPSFDFVQTVSFRSRIRY